MTVQEIGQKVKAQYPQYKNLSDDEVGRRAVDKYPEYQKQLTSSPDVSPTPASTSDQESEQPFSRKASDALREFGLGAFPDAAATVHALFQGGKVTKDNPFVSSEQHAKMREKPLEHIAKNTAGVASYSPHLLATKTGLLARLGMGGIQGGLQSISQEDATVGSVAAGSTVGAGINAILPGISNLISKALGKTAFGKGGEMYPDIVREVGAVTNPNELFQKTAPIREKLTQLVESSGNTMAKSAVFGKQQPGGGMGGGVIDDILSKLGFSDEGAGKNYLSKRSADLDELFRTHLSKLPETTGDQLANVANAPDLDIPLQVWQEFMRKVGLDVPQKNWLQGMMSKTEPEEIAAKDLRTKLRGMISAGTNNPNEYDRLNKLLQASSSINRGMNSGGTMSNLVRNLGSLGLPSIGGIGSLLSGNPIPAIGGVAAGVASNPRASGTIISLLESLPADVIRNFLMRSGATAADEVN